MDLEVILIVLALCFANMYILWQAPKPLEGENKVTHYAIKWAAFTLPVTILLALLENH